MDFEGRGWEHLFGVEVFLAAQMPHSAVDRSHGERRLIFRLLRDALKDLVRGRDRAHDAALLWLLDERSVGWAFGAADCCYYLGVDHRALVAFVSRFERQRSNVRRRKEETPDGRTRAQAGNQPAGDRPADVDAAGAMRTAPGGQLEAPDVPAGVSGTDADDGTDIGWRITG